MCINKIGLEGEMHDLRSLSKESEFCRQWEAIVRP